jgi:hypothetical protein
MDPTLKRQIGTSGAEVTQLDRVLVNRRTRHLVDGHLRVELARHRL